MRKTSPRIMTLALLATVCILTQSAAVSAAPLLIKAYGAPTPPPPPQIGYGHANPKGQVMGLTSRYFTRDGKPWMPLMGEFEYARYPSRFWNRELLKMRAGGVNIVSSYIYWNVQERRKGIWNWRGRRNLRQFVKLAAKDGLLVWLRIGPWSHSEMRYGGYPDWLEKMHIPLGQVSQPYMSYAAILYKHIAGQLHGLYWHDGGPIIGVQYDNENPHMRYIAALRKLALHDGTRVPFDTMTGWQSDKVTKGVMPLFGFYADGFWIRSLHWSHSALAGYQFWKPSYDSPTHYPFPFADAELGGGMAVSYPRRPFMYPNDIGAAELAAIGSGLVLPGFYEYQGGRDPIDRHCTFEETQRNGGNTMPIRNYSFQAPLGEYGQVTPTYNLIRVMAMLQHQWGLALAPMPPYLPLKRPKGINDVTTVRWAVRASARRGFLFIDNYERMITLPPHHHVQFNVRMAKAHLIIPANPVTIPSGMYMIWPMNLPIGSATMAYGTVQPLTKLTVRHQPWYFFFAWPHLKIQLAFKRDGVRLDIPSDATEVKTGGLILVNLPRAGKHCVVTVHGPKGQTSHVVILTRNQALRSWTVHFAGRQRLVTTAKGDYLYVQGHALKIFSSGANSVTHFAIFPAPAHPAFQRVSVQVRHRNIFTHYQITMPALTLSQPQVKQVKPVGPPIKERMGATNVAGMPTAATFARSEATWKITIPVAILNSAHNVFMNIHYAGDVARLYAANGKLIDDDFWYGRRYWSIALDQIKWALKLGPLTLDILPLTKGAPIYINHRLLPDFGNAKDFCQLRRITLHPIREVVIKP
ncbi:MAG: beta-galactosidase [Phycisphaerae bacterium]